jgi:hypothetical protein
VRHRQVTIEKSPSASERRNNDSTRGHIIEHHRNLILRQLLDQPEQFLTLHAHDPGVRRQPLIALALRRARCVPDQTVNQGIHGHSPGHRHEPRPGPQQVSALRAAAFQAGHAGSIPVARSRHLRCGTQSGLDDAQMLDTHHQHDVVPVVPTPPGAGSR